MKISEIRLTEERDPDTKYVDTLAKGEVTKVTAILTAQKSSAATKMGKKYQEIDKLAASIKAQRDELNAQAKGMIEEYFDVEDEVYTRVLDTKSMIITMSKKQTSSTSKFDITGFLEELYTVVPDLADQLKMLEEKYTTVKKSMRKPSLSAPKFKDPVSESITSKMQSVVTTIVSYIKKRLARTDDAIYALKQKYQITF